MTRKSKQYNNNRKKNLLTHPKKINVPQKFVTEACAFTDPFCQHSYGASHPSGSDRPVFSVTKRTTRLVSTGAGGYGGFYFRPGSSCKDLAIITPIASDMSAPSPLTDGINTSTISAGIYGVRVVSAGVRWWNTSAATAGGGIVTAVPFNADQEVIGATISASDLQGAYNAYSGNVRDPGAYIFPHRNFSDHFKPYSTSGAVLDDEDEHHGGLMLMVQGDASTQYLAVEFVVHLEFELVSLEGYFDSGHHTQPKLTKDVYGKISGFFRGQVDHVSKQVEKKIKEALVKLAKNGVKAAIGYTFGPEAYALTNLIPEVD